MKINFRRNMPDNMDMPFGIYHYDELLAQNSLYIDIRGIVRKNSWNWLDEIHASYSDVSKAFLRYTRLWWLTGMSRLDIRPWWQESLVKPLLYAKAVLEWIRLNPEVKEILLIGCEPMVAVYLKEFDGTLILEGKGITCQPLLLVFQALKQSVVAMLKMLASAYRIGRHHAFKPFTDIKFKTIILYELVSGLLLTSGYKYFYGSIFDEANNTDKKSMGYCRIGHAGSALAIDRDKIMEDNSCFFLLDNIKLSELLVAVLKNIYIILVTCIITFTKKSCQINGSFSYRFWPRFL